MSKLLDTSSNGCKVATGVMISIGAVAAAGAIYYFVKKIRNAPPKKWIRVGEISDLAVFPIKSCGAIRQNSFFSNILGLEDGELRDRIFMVITREGQFVTARTHPKLVHIQPAFKGDVMTLSAPGMRDIDMNVKELHQKPTQKTSVWGQGVHTVDVGEEVATWLSRFILGEDTGLRLMFYPASIPSRDVRDKNKAFDGLKMEDVGALHDASSYMLLNEASLTDLNNRLDHDVPAQQFRPNFVVKGPEAFAEDKWDWVRIGEVVFRNVKPCTRCIFTNIDPESAKRDPEGNPLKLLKSYRSIIPGESPVFGIHLAVRKKGIVNLGDPVYIGARK